MFQDSFQETSVASLQDALKQAKETAKKLDRDLHRQYKANYLQEQYSSRDHRQMTNEIVNL